MRIAARWLPPLLALAGALTPAALRAAPAPAPLPGEAQPLDGQAGESAGEIVVIGIRRPAPADLIPPEKRYSQDEVRSFGAGNVAEVVDAVSARSRNGLGEAAIVLLNGRRISGFGEINGLPPEAVKSVDVLPEKVALAYGYGPGRRVINVVLLDRFAATTLDASASAATEGGRASGRAATGTVRISGTTRWSLDGSYQRETMLLESERAIRADPVEAPYDIVGNLFGMSGEIDPRLSLLAGSPVSVAAVPASASARIPALQDFLGSAGRLNVTAQAPYRSLLPRAEKASLNGTVSGFVLGTLSGTLNLRADRTEADERLGLPGAVLVLPAGNPFSPFQSPVALYRAYGTSPVSRRVTNTNVHAGGILNGVVGPWQWSLTANVDESRVESRISGLVDAASLQARLDSNDPTFNPFGSAAVFAPSRTSSWATHMAGAELVAYGKILSLPAGPLTGSVTAAEQHTGLSSADALGSGQLSRDRQSVQVTVDLPLVAGRGGKGLGTVSANGSAAVSRLSGFGTIRRLSAGLDWRLRPQVALTAGWLDEDRAPAMQQLGEAAVELPNARLFDLSHLQTVDVVRIDGGNRGLFRSNRRQLSAGLLLKPLRSGDLSLRADYVRLRERNPVFAFPVFTTELEPSFPARFFRDASGRLVRVDARPVNFASATQETLRWGLSWSHAYRARGKAPLRLDLNAFHSWTLEDRALVAPGGQRLDFLDGSAAGPLGGRPAHRVDVQGGFYRNGIGLRLDAAYRGPTFVRSPAAGDKALFFSGLATADVRLFWDSNADPKVAQRHSWARGFRVTLAVANLFDSRPRVRLRDGTTPLAYQPALLDPAGRTVSISLRKLFS